VDDKKHHIRLIEKLNYFLQGNLHAVRFCVDLTYIAHVWDDLYDRDKERTGQEINDAFRIALVDIPANPFYLQNITQLWPLMMSAILQWQDANVLEKGSRHDKQMAYMLRASFLQIFNYAAYLVGGPDWARQIGPGLRRMYEESFQSFSKEMMTDA